DEPKVLYAAGRALAVGDLLAESNISVPILPHALFQGQLIFLFGPGRWAIRTYSLVGGVLCTLAAFAAARALQLAVVPSLAVAGLVVVLPWSLFYSRVMTGTELTFFQLLLIAALARIVFPLPSRARFPLPPGGGQGGGKQPITLPTPTKAYWRAKSLGADCFSSPSPSPSPGGRGDPL